MGRVIRRLASPEALVAALPPGTVHYGVKVADVRVTDTGACNSTPHAAFMSVAQPACFDSCHTSDCMTDVLLPVEGAEVELEGGRKLRGRMVVCADGVHSKTAAKYHKAPLQFTRIIGWRRAPFTRPILSLVAACCRHLVCRLAPGQHLRVGSCMCGQ